MTAYHDRLQRGEYLPGTSPHYDQDNPNPDDQVQNEENAANEQPAELPSPDPEPAEEPTEPAEDVEGAPE